GNGTTAHGRGPRASSASAGRAATGRRLAALVGTARRRSRVMARLRRAPAQAGAILPEGDSAEQLLGFDG
ncbi:MAG TPA: hypothetical protein VFE42_17130, partial [Chloroflexota bacterium]|nr:hypothetical protein [Chloroflexota bacterium]